MPFPLLFHRLLPFGRRAEILAIHHLRSAGYRVVASGYRTRGGEVDVIAWEGNVLVFIEVKARQNADPPQDAVGFRKRQRIIQAAHTYISRHRLDDAVYRFDIVAISVLPKLNPQFQILRDAFRADE